MKKSFAQELVAPCDMNCTVCSGYLALKYDLKSNGIRMSYCTGCRPRDKKCAFLKKTCKNLMNHTVQFCYECKEFPCEKLKQIDMRYQKNFRMSLLKNLTDIKTNGMKKFLRTQEEKWCCPNCGGVICCHNGLCFQCDNERLKNKKKRYRWEDD
jgi:hypothetical protein